MTLKRRSHTKAFKIDAVKLVTEGGYNVAEAARNLDLHPNLLRRWKEQLTNDHAQSFPGKGHMISEKEELNQLRKENKRLRMEHEILKKAAAFFAKESM
jgi:transposase